MTNKSLFDRIDVPNPCDKSWNSMVGDNQTRLCLHCDTTIHNLSEMSDKEVTKLLFQNKGSVCVRLTRDADGKVQTNDRKFHQIKRNTRLAASFLSITLALTTVPFAQSITTKTLIENQSKTQQNLLTLTITDSNNGVIPNAQVKIINLETKIEQIGRSNENGEHKFVIDKLGNYEIVVDGISGFKELRKTVEFAKENLTMKLQLDVVESVVGTTITSGGVQLLPKETGFRSLLNLKPDKKLQKLQHKTSQISFTIFDTNGAIIANAEVKLTNDKTKKEFIVNTNSQGIAYFSFLPHGRYQVKALASNFRSSIMSVIVKEESEPNIEMSLEVGATTGVISINWYETPIFNSIIQNDIEVIKNYVALRKNVNIKDEFHQNTTMLHVAVGSDNLEIIKLLFKAGANINAKDKIGRTPIMMIDLGEENSLEIIKLLIAKGANLNIQNKDEDNQTLLMSACDDNNLEIVKLLLEAGASPNLKDDDGETAMMKTTSEEIRSLLRKFGAKR
jgi:Ankyrin repeats (3 copies)/Carboxypeptidase regulatory-like domain